MKGLWRVERAEGRVETGRGSECLRRVSVWASARVGVFNLDLQLEEAIIYADR